MEPLKEFLLSFDKAVEERLLRIEEYEEDQDGIRYLIWLIKSNNREITFYFIDEHYTVTWKEYYFGSINNFDKVMSECYIFIKDIDLCLDIIMEMTFRDKVSRLQITCYSLEVYNLYQENPLLSFNEFFNRYQICLEPLCINNKEIYLELPTYIKTQNDRRVNPIWDIWNLNNKGNYLQWVPEEVLEDIFDVGNMVKGKPYQRSLTKDK